ncbi:hypothetical protein EYF80_002602 [Liparis tanakae]|uniref:Uncharacterized protein n=1 Tax=Liparis tanakae TaxID=230148 RepID=A0A4Z2JBM3_9TELE|nr:hypothetical protein EYF80_002602 [Liparis tanakae]
MEIPSVVDLEGRQSRTCSGLQNIAFSTQKLTSESSAPSANSPTDHRGSDSLPEAQRSLLESDEDTHRLKESFICVSHNNIECDYTWCLQESEQSVILSEAPLDPAPLASAQLHEAGIVSTLPRTNDDRCSLPVPVVEDQALQNNAGRTVDLNSGCVITHFERLETISNGHVCVPPGDPCPILNLNSTPTLTVPSTVPESSRRVLDLPRIVKHKPSSITFSHFTFFSGADGNAFVNESSDNGESSLEEEEEEEDDHNDGDDGDDDDVFSEWPQNRECVVNRRQRSMGKDKQKRRAAASARAEINHWPRSCGHKAAVETRSQEESPQVTSPWSESMSHLMRKLDQLNLDIEEALSANSSPSNTPCTTRKKQCGALSKSTLNQALKHQVPQRPDGGECPSRDGSSAARSATMGTRATTKKTVSCVLGQPLSFTYANLPLHVNMVVGESKANSSERDSCCSCVEDMCNKLTNAAGAAVPRAQASSLTPGHCLLVEADCDLRQLQCLSFSISGGLCDEINVREKRNDLTRTNGFLRGREDGVDYLERTEGKRDPSSSLSSMIDSRCCREAKGLGLQPSPPPARVGHSSHQTLCPSALKHGPE